MRNLKGFSIVELLIVMAILGLVMTGIYTLFNDFYRSSKIESKNVETEIEKVLTSNLLEADITQAGTGLADNLNNIPISWSNGKLTIRSVFNVTNNKTDGWLLVDCDNGSWSIISSKGNLSSQSLVFLNIVDKSFIANGSYGICPQQKVMIAFPYDSTSSNGCITQYCNKITYSLSTTQPIGFCNSGTRNLLRKVGNSNIGTHIFDCVADFYVNFDYDTDGNGYISSAERGIQIPTADNATIIKSKLKSVNIYILLQEGEKDIDFYFTGHISNGNLLLSDKNNNGVCDTGDICFALPSNYIHYRWKPVILRINPMGL